MKRHHWLSRRLIIASLVFVLLAMAVSIGFTSSVGLAQGTPEVEWDKTFGGPKGDHGHSVQQTSDGGYIIAGYTNSFSADPRESDVWLIKTDSGGNKQWDKTFGGSLSDRANSVQQTSDGGYIIAGYTQSFGAGSADVWLIKTDSGGNKQWDKTFGGSLSDHGYSVQQTSDGGYIITGYTIIEGYPDVWLIKTDSGGNKTWDKTFGDLYNDHAKSVQQTSDGGYIIAGYTSSYGDVSGDVWLIKTDSWGNKQWAKTFGGPHLDSANSVQQTSDGGYIIAGYTVSFGAGSADVWLIKTDSGGNKQWDKTFGGSLSDHGYSVQQTSDGGYIIVGFTNSFGAGECDVWLIKTDSGGNKTWDKTFGSHLDDSSWSVQQTSDGGYIIAGYGYFFPTYEVWLIKVSNPPNDPTNLSPDNGKTGVSITPTLTSSQFFDPDAGDTHAASQWQITTILGDYASPVFDSGTDAIKLTSITIPSGILSYSTTYYWHVRHQDNHGAWSDYSSETSFTTGADSDGDGLTDAEEASGWDITIYNCDGSVSETYHVTSDPYQADQDGDGLNDKEEKEGWHVKYRYQVSPPPHPVWMWVEYDVKSNPHDANIDIDGKNDKQEKAAKTDPNRANTDCDGHYATTDGFEIDYGLNPLDFDTDNDGFADGLEIDLWLEAGYSLDEAVANTSDPAAIPAAPPVANAGPDQTVTDADRDGFEDVTLDGSGSYDLDGTIVSYEWKEGETILSTVVSFTHSFAVGLHTVILIVTDDDGATDSDEVVILVKEAGPCFIATAAYGTSTAEEIDVLRAFRDEVLLENSLSSQLVTLYYEVSPPLADFISEHEPLRTLVRELLVDPVASLVKATEAIWGD